MADKTWLEGYVDAIIENGSCTRAQWKRIKDEVMEDDKETPEELEQVSRLLKAVFEDKTVTLIP